MAGADTTPTGSAPRDCAQPWIERWAGADGARPALIGAAQVLTFAGLRDAAVHAAARLAAAGVERGDRVALLLGNRLEFAVWLHAVSRCGAVAVPLGPRLPAAEIEALLRVCRCALLCSDAAHRPTVEALPAASAPRRIDIDGAAEAKPGTTAAALLDLDAPHTIIFTSGSTGTAKGVVLTARNHLASARAVATVLGTRGGDRWLACLPFHHVGGLAILLRSALDGTPVIVHERFDAVAVNRAIDADGATLVPLVANMLQRVLDARGGRPFPPTLRAVLLGGGPAPAALLADCERRGVPVAPTYGMTEAASQVATLPPGEAPGRLHSAGRPLPGIDLRIVRDGVELPRGAIGEIELRGAAISPGYLAAEGLVRHGEWLRTSDLGALDGDGYLTVVGRADDVIITGGEKVHPREIECALESHPAVAEACAFGLPSREWGESPAAWVRLHPGAQVEMAALAAFVRQQLAAFKAPRHLRAVDDFPRSAAGKILRHAVREAAARENGA